MSEPSVLAYVQALVPRLTGAPPDQVAALVAAATALQAAVDNPASVTRPQWDALVAAGAEVRDALRTQLAEAVLASIPIADVRALLAHADWDALGGFAAEPELGPLRLTVSAPPLALRFPADALAAR